MPIRSHPFPKSRRLGGRSSFPGVRAQGKKLPRGPLIFWIATNNLQFTRIGISIGRPVGNAVKRNLIKRRIREAFRLAQHELPAGVDVVISVRPHEALAMVEYQELLRTTLNPFQRC